MLTQREGLPFNSNPNQLFLESTALAVEVHPSTGYKVPEVSEPTKTVLLIIFSEVPKMIPWFLLTK